MGLVLQYEAGNEIYIGPGVTALIPKPMWNNSIRVHGTEGVWAAPVQSALDLTGRSQFHARALPEYMYQQRQRDVAFLELETRNAIEEVLTHDELRETFRKDHRRGIFQFGEPFFLAGDKYYGRMHVFHQQSHSRLFEGPRIFLDLPDDVNVTQEKVLHRVIQLLRAHAPRVMQTPLEELEEIFEEPRRDIERILRILQMPGLSMAVNAQGRMLRRDAA